MKNLNKLLTAAILVACTALFADQAQAAYAFDMLDPGYVAAVAPGSLPTTCRLLAADVTHGQPIYIDCNSVNGLSATPIAGSFTTLLASGTITGGSASNIAINTNKFTVAASSGNTLVAGTLAVTGATTATGGIDGVLGGVTPAAATATTITANTSLVSKTANDLSPTFSTGITANPVVMTTKGTCTTAAVNGGTCIPLVGVAARTITVTHFDIVAAGSAATCTGILLEDTNGTPVVIATLAAAQLTSAAHNIPLTATLGVGFGAGSGLTSAKGVQIIKNGSDCATTTSFAYTFTYTIQ